MKKIGVLIFTLIACLFITGCGCEKTKYTVKFDSNGGSLVNSVEVEKGDLVSKPVNPTKEGYEFDGWYLDGTKYDFSTEVVNNITLIAHWSEKTDVKEFTVKFDSNGGTTVEEQKVKEGKKVTEPTTSKAGYTFIGWHLEDKKYDFSKEVTADITLVAKWEKNTSGSSNTVTKYTVKFDSNGGSEVLSTVVQKNKTISKPTNPTRDGYTFIGWYLGEKEYNFNTKVTKNITLVAKWKKNTDESTEPIPVVKYTVKFDSNGGSEITNAVVEANSTVTKPAAPTRDGYTFTGWYLDGTKYDFSNVVTKDITLKATWEKNPVVEYVVEQVKNSTMNQVRIYVTKDGNKIDGTVDATSQSGKTITIDVPKTGKVVLSDTYPKLENPREK